MLSFLVEWKGGVTCHSLGEMGSYCFAKIFGRMGAKEYLSILQSFGYKRGMEIVKIFKIMDLGALLEILGIRSD